MLLREEREFIRWPLRRGEDALIQRGYHSGGKDVLTFHSFVSLFTRSMEGWSIGSSVHLSVVREAIIREVRMY